MFYDKNLMNSRHLGKVWRAANDIEDSSDEDTSMPIICNNLDSWIASYHEDTNMRLSLRTSSVMVDGAAKIYKRKLNSMYTNGGSNANMALSTSQRKKGRDIKTEFNLSRQYGQSHVTQLDFELTFRKRIRRRSSGFHDDISSTFTESVQDVPETASDEQTDGDINTELVDTSDKSNSDLSLSPNNKQEPHNRSRVDKSIQVSPDSGEPSFNEELPFGHIIIYDRYKDRIPSRIIFSSLNYNINKLA